MLKITAPFREKEEVIPLIEAGADELYCGYLSPEWIKRYTSLEFERKGGGSNFTSIEELKKAVDLAHSKEVPVFLTLNGLYVNHQYPLLLDIVEQVDRINLDGFIIADVGLLLTLKEKKIKKQLHISTGGTVFNHEAVKFYQALGASRIILDRQVTINDMKNLSEENPGIDFEVFILNTLCVYIDGFCTFLHTYAWQFAENISRKDWKENEKLGLVTVYDTEAQTDACSLEYSVQAYNEKGEKLDSKKKINPTFYNHLLDGMTECGACAIYNISRTKVKSIKIVGRQLTPDIRVKSTKFIRAVLDIIKNNHGITKREFIKKTQRLYRQTWEYNKECKGNNCYHPSVLSDI